MSNILQQAITLIKSGDKQKGYCLLVEVIKSDPTNEVAWLWMSSVVTDDEKREYCLNQVIKINPNNQFAQKGLVTLQAKQNNISHQPPPQIDPPPQKEPSIRPIKKDPPVQTKHNNVWINSDGLGNKVTVLYEYKIVTANLTSTSLKQLQTEFQTMPPPPSMFEKNVETIPILTITQVKTDRNSKSVTISYKEDNKASATDIDFSDHQARDQFFATLQRRLGVGFEYRLKSYNALEAAIVPILVLAAIIFATYLFHGAAVEFIEGTEPTIRGRHQLLKYIFAGIITTLGPTGVLVVGVIFIAICLFWMFARILQPPVMMTLSPSKTPIQVKPESQETEEIPWYIQQPDDKVEEQLAEASSNPTEPSYLQKTVSPQTLVRLLLIGSILFGLSFTGWLFISRMSVYMNLIEDISFYLTSPPSFPGLIEGGLVLDLSGRGLTDDDLRALSIQDVPQTRLALVDLSYNQFTELPPEIGQLTSIKSLYIHDGQLTTLPPEIGQLTNLELLHLGNNKLTSLPPQLGLLTNLETLYVSQNQLKTLPPELGYLPNLKEIIVQFNPIEELPRQITDKPGLQVRR